MEMFGFKSFADRTCVEFEPGITVVVGPNGCGKSNIVDSIKWVLGEKQAKSIRGTTMEDVIFSGTEQRKPVSLAEVSLTINNSERILDIDSDSVIVSRRIFRDGESEYLINKSPVRLKDLERLFLDTGIGKSSYSVMEQGKMDLILSTKAEDRRYIFEEAAGISRYKMQKKESLRRLQETGENLERINDIIHEIEREKDLKSKQAEKTKLYLGLKAEHNELDIKLNALKHRDLVRREEKLLADIEKLKQQQAEISARVASISAENEKDEKRKNDLQHQLHELDKRLHEYRIRLGDIDAKTEKNRELIVEQEGRKKSTEKKLSERAENMNRLSEERTKTEQSGVDIKARIASDREKLAVFFETRKRKIDSIHSSRDKIEVNKRTIREKEHKLRELREALEVVIRKLIDAIDRRKIELQDSEEERQGVRQKIHSSLEILERSLVSARECLDAGRTIEAMEHLKEIDAAALREDITSFESYEDGFRSILFDKTGIHAEKENLDHRIADETRDIENLRAEITALEEHITLEQKELEDVNSMIRRIENDLATNETNREWIERQIVSLDVQIKDVIRQMEGFREDMTRSDGIIENLKKEIAEWENRLVDYNEKSRSLVQNIAELTGKREEIEKRIGDRRNVSLKDEQELKNLVERIGAQDRTLVELVFRKDSIKDYLWTEYEKKIADVERIPVDESQLQALQNSMADVKKKIQDLGPVNNLAIQEYRDLKKRFEYYLEQKNDIEKARQDILSVIDDINRTSVEMFISTFKEIQKNFSEVFRRLFEGGEASINILEPENVLESGIDIVVCPPGKKPKNINLLSGGERALTAIALLFATYMVKPSPFCFLDEIDAPLDEENIGRFLRMLKEFARGTQFVIVTHNKKTMSIGESIYGVTMEEPGVSKIVSLQMKRIEKPSVS